MVQVLTLMSKKGVPHQHILPDRLVNHDYHLIREIQKLSYERHKAQFSGVLGETDPKLFEAENGIWPSDILKARSGKFIYRTLAEVNLHPEEIANFVLTAYLDGTPVNALLIGRTHFWWVVVNAIPSSKNGLAMNGDISKLTDAEITKCVMCIMEDIMIAKPTSEGITQALKGLGHVRMITADDMVSELNMWYVPVIEIVVAALQAVFLYRLVTWVGRNYSTFFRSGAPAGPEAPPARFSASRFDATPSSSAYEEEMREVFERYRDSGRTKESLGLPQFVFVDAPLMIGPPPDKLMIGPPPQLSDEQKQELLKFILKDKSMKSTEAPPPGQAKLVKPTDIQIHGDKETGRYIRIGRTALVEASPNDPTSDQVLAIRVPGTEPKLVVQDSDGSVWATDPDQYDSNILHAIELGRKPGTVALKSFKRNPTGTLDSLPFTPSQASMEQALEEVIDMAKDSNILVEIVHRIGQNVAETLQSAEDLLTAGALGVTNSFQSVTDGLQYIGRGYWSFAAQMKEFIDYQTDLSSRAAQLMSMLPPELAHSPDAARMALTWSESFLADFKEMSPPKEHMLQGELREMMLDQLTYGSKRLDDTSHWDDSDWSGAVDEVLPRLWEEMLDGALGISDAQDLAAIVTKGVSDSSYWIKRAKFLDNAEQLIENAKTETPEVLVPQIVELIEDRQRFGDVDLLENGGVSQNDVYDFVNLISSPEPGWSTREHAQNIFDKVSLRITPGAEQYLDAAARGVMSHQVRVGSTQQLQSNSALVNKESRTTQLPWRQFFSDEVPVEDLKAQIDMEREYATGQQNPLFRMMIACKQTVEGYVSSIPAVLNMLKLPHEFVEILEDRDHVQRVSERIEKLVPKDDSGQQLLEEFKTMSLEEIDAHLDSLESKNLGPGQIGEQTEPQVSEPTQDGSWFTPGELVDIQKNLKIDASNWWTPSNKTALDQAGESNNNSTLGFGDVNGRQGGVGMDLGNGWFAPFQSTQPGNATLGLPRP